MASQPIIKEILPENYRLLQEHVYSNVGIVLESNKHYLFESRLAPIVRELGLESINELCAVLKKGSDRRVGHQVAESMTTNETYFFRDPAHYEAIRTVLLPALRKERQDTKKLRFWSAACSAGQEAYSLAMVLAQEGFADWNTQIFGTDFSSKMVERARAGTYQQIEVNRGLPVSLLVKHFQRSGVDWQLNDTLRRMAHFETRDLRNSMRSLGPFDLVFCRNVMIYFDAETKRKIMKEIHGTLFRGGWLLVGGAETGLDLDEWYERRAIGSVTIYVAR